LPGWTAALNWISRESQLPSENSLTRSSHETPVK
jgi:hypothetical protein